jgi:hypothetical protein
MVIYCPWSALALKMGPTGRPETPLNVHQRTNCDIAAKRMPQPHDGGGLKFRSVSYLYSDVLQADLTVYTKFVSYFLSVTL